MKPNGRICILLVITFLAGRSVAEAQHVRVTPLGQKTGEFCSQDRAIIFEDPTGVRILYDPGMTVAGGTDPRLNEVHAILVSHGHGDHLGTSKLNQDPDAPASSCAGGGMTTVMTASTNTAEIAAAKNSAVILGGGLSGNIASRIAAILQSPTPPCPATGLTNEFTVPRTAPCTSGLGISGKRTIRHLNATRGVQVAIVPAEHPNDLSANLLTEPERTELGSNNLNAWVGPANGFIVTFTNGLRAYLSGDTGLMSDMKLIFNDYYRVNLAVMNISDTFVTGPDEAAFAVSDLLGVTSVIPSHANQASTEGGGVVAGTRTARFIELLSPGNRGRRDDPPNLRSGDDFLDLIFNRKRVSVHVPLSGITMQFDGRGQCQVGCRGR
jgi:L-ascorbate metabolism protein UlaG (beta-lactamase superfamily)